MLAQLDELKSRGIAVDVLPVGFAYDKEVWLERLDLPRVVKAGETYEATRAAQFARRRARAN